MPPRKLTNEEKQHLFEKATEFSTGAKKQQSKFTPDHEKYKLNYGSEEQIRQNLENPDLVKRHLMAKEIYAKYERRNMIFNSLLYRYGSVKPGADHNLERSIISMMKAEDTPEAKRYNEELYLKYIDPEGSKLLYQEYIEKVRNFDFSKLNEALKTPETAMKFYDENCDVITGLFAPEHLFSKTMQTPEFSAQIDQIKNMMTGMMGINSLVKYYASPAMFALPEVPKMDQIQMAVTQGMIFASSIKQPDMHMMVDHMTGISQWTSIATYTETYQKLGGSLTPGKLFQNSIVGENGKPEKMEEGFDKKVGLKIVPNDPEKQAQIDQSFTNETLAEFASYQTPEAEAARARRYEADKQRVISEEAAKAEKEANLPKYAETHKKYMSHNGFVRLFMFGSRRKLRTMEQNLREKGATELELLLARHDNRLDPNRAENFKAQIQEKMENIVGMRKSEAETLEQKYELGVQCQKELKQIANDIRLLNGAEIPGKENREAEAAELLQSFDKTTRAAGLMEVNKYEFGPNSEKMKEFLSGKAAPADNVECEPVEDVIPEFENEVSENNVIENTALKTEETKTKTMEDLHA